MIKMSQFRLVVLLVAPVVLFMQPSASALALWGRGETFESVNKDLADVKLAVTDYKTKFTTIENNMNPVLRVLRGLNAMRTVASGSDPGFIRMKKGTGETYLPTAKRLEQVTGAIQTATTAKTTVEKIKAKSALVSFFTHKGVPERLKKINDTVVGLYQSIIDDLGAYKRALEQLETAREATNAARTATKDAIAKTRTDKTAFEAHTAEQEKQAREELEAAGGLTAVAGTTTGTATGTTGEAAVTTGEAAVRTGEAAVTTGDVAVTTGDVAVTTGEAAVTTGGPVADPAGDGSDPDEPTSVDADGDGYYDGWDPDSLDLKSIVLKLKA